MNILSVLYKWTGSQDAPTKDVFKLECLWTYITWESPFTACLAQVITYNVVHLRKTGFLCKHFFVGPKPTYKKLPGLMLPMLHGTIYFKGSQDAPTKDVFKVECLWAYVTRDPGTPFRSCLIQMITYNVFHTGGPKPTYKELPGLMLSMLNGDISLKGNQDAPTNDVFRVECLWVYVKRKSGTPSYILLIQVITYKVFHTGGLKSIYRGLPELMLSMLNGIIFRGSLGAPTKDVFKEECLWVYGKRESGTPSHLLRFK